MVPVINTLDELLVIYGEKRVVEALQFCERASVRDRRIVIRRMQGWTLRAISEECKLHRETVRCRIVTAVKRLHMFIVNRLAQEEIARRKAVLPAQYRRVDVGEKFRMGESDKIDE